MFRKLFRKLALALCALTAMAAPAAAAPEPAAWALMIAGFGFAGGALRRRRAGAASA